MENIQGISWSIVVMFVLLSPLALTIGPSLPVDINANNFIVHWEGHNDTWANPVSWGALSVWPIVTLFAAGQTGVDRIFYSSQELLVGRFTYWEIGNFLFLGLMLIAAARMALRQASGARPYDYTLVIALATMGAFMFKTGSPAYYFVPAIALVILTRASVKNLAYYFMVVALSIVTVVALYGIGVFWLGSNPLLGVGLFDIDNPITHFAQGIMNSDQFINLGASANIVVLICLVVEVMRPLFASRRWDRQRP